MTNRALAAVLLCSLLATTPLRAEAPPAAPGNNIQLTLAVTAERDGKVEQSKTFALVCPDNGSRVTLSESSRVPVPATPAKADAGNDGGPVSSFTYEHVGFTTGLRCVRLNDGRIAVEGSCEDSSLRGGGPGAPAPPIVAGFSLEIDVRLASGKPLTVARFSDAKGFSTTLTIEAKPLD